MQEIARVPPIPPQYTARGVDQSMTEHLQEVDRQWNDFEREALKGLICGTLLAILFWAVIALIIYHIVWQ